MTRHGGDPPRPVLTSQQEAYLGDLLKQVYPRVLRAVARMSRDHHLAEEITQDVAVAMFKEVLAGRAFRRPPIVFAVTVARNRVRSEFRRRRRAAELPTDDFPEGAEPWPPRPRDPDPTTAAARYLDLLAEVEAAIGDERRFRIWELHVVWDLKGFEIAEALGMSAPTVSRELRRAVEKARRIS
ncbi:RNA polymerase sigma factor [Streptantibioticus cattleyicolor]|uniref:RNA polymerase sigma-70 region 2 domain-containing protein n=1 Tax=Streptantibioticus cattleyicolor (strain ATCC 35852 / DSM 46488 / JCM 4925 / NBRC 14057 / NRRL 8057) TaxID=1003195 RepID=F8JJT7_STREN|nr:sigma-70 family RNA polymerase sigma factor [Streptantibioticus cattleyicolor]AEW98636.1 hypothetical protein SCATT_p04430 [Streptantibioticus cattleyicolor NRRL 8057 = DSM 46488]CCB72304.1 putative RNA polymerase sigma-70 factor [Streptantibioticus cattleyicolor NRRL 8057 = DSM 46488]